MLFVLALCAYDWFLTVAAEREYIWAKNKSLVFYLFVILRYATLGYQLTFNLAFFLPIHSDKVGSLADREKLRLKTSGFSLGVIIAERFARRNV